MKILKSSEIKLLLKDIKKIAYKYIVFVLVVLFLVMIYYVLWSHYNKITDLWLFWTSSYGIISSIFGVSIALFGFYINYKSHKENISLLSHLKYKEHINLLEKFDYKFRKHKSIYKNVISMFNNCLKLLTDDENNVDENKVKVFLLMCSPAFDNPKRLKGKFNEWGSEFAGLIRKIIQYKCETHIYYLPYDDVLGFNPLKNFNEVIANYCFTNLPEEVKTQTLLNQIFEDIDNQTKTIIKQIELLDENPDFPLHANKIALFDVPFQIFIYKSEEHSEVVVSFAGKAIIESGSDFEPKGFHSSDEDVVSSVLEIFKAYVDEHRRIPLKPNHTLNIIKATQNKSNHIINNYMNFGINLSINRNIFSPAFANSSKFASDVILKHLYDKDTKVIDIGSGTGAQAIVAYKKLIQLGNNNPIVLAIEPCKEPYDNLLINIKNNHVNVGHKNWEMKASFIDSSSKEIVVSPELLVKEGYNCFKRKFNILGGELYLGEDKYVGKFKGVLVDNDNHVLSFFQNNIEKFNLVIADLPFVDTSSSDDFQRAFFDENHFAQFVLFRTFEKADWIDQNATLLTTFSTLGGADDVYRFERMINKNNLLPILKYTYYEDGYHWIVYIIKRNLNYDNNYWRNKLLCKTD